MAIRNQTQRAKPRINTREMNRLERYRNRRNAPPEEYLTRMRDGRNVVEFDNLYVSFFTDEGEIQAVSGVSFDIPAGSTCCVVGESGCGKSVMSLSLMQLLQRPQGQIVAGTIRLDAGDAVYDIASTPENSRTLDLLAALSHQTNFSIGCYCADEEHCHRSVLRALLLERGAEVEG